MRGLGREEGSLRGLGGSWEVWVEKKGVLGSLGGACGGVLGREEGGLRGFEGGVRGVLCSSGGALWAWEGGLRGFGGGS